MTVLMDSTRHPTINPADRATWPELLTLPEVAIIFRRRVGGMRKSLQAETFRPKPFYRRPYRWRKSDVQRFLDKVSR